MSKELKVNLNEELAQGIYSNLAVVTHSGSEFIVDFCRIMPKFSPKGGIKGDTSTEVKSRIILTPEHAERFMNTLRENIEGYETKYGRIQNTTIG